MLENSQPRSSRGVSGDDPEGGARRGVLRRRLATARPGRPGKSPARHYDLAARSSLHGSGGNAGDGSAAPGEKSPRWSAEKRASRVTGREAPRRRLAYRVISAFTRVFDAHDTPHGCLARTRTFLGAPPTPRSGSVKQGCKTRAQTCAAGMRWAV